MTPLTKSVRRIVRDKEGSELVAELLPHGLSIRIKGQRKRFPTLGWGWLYLQAAKLQVAEDAAEKRRAKR